MPIKIFQLDDWHWWAGESLAACIAAARLECGADSYPEAEQDGRELDSEDMQRLLYLDDSDGALAPVQLTFAEQLEREVAQGGHFPRLFASTEW